MLKEAYTKPKHIRLVTFPDSWNKKLQNLLGNQLIDYSEIYHNPGQDKDEKIKTLKKVLSENVIAFERVRFKFNKVFFIDQNDSFASLPEGYELKRIDDTIYSKITGKIVPSFSWDTKENFLNKGVGYCLLKEGMVVSTSFSSFISKDMIDVGIETDLNYRGQGLGVFPAAAMIHYCLEKGYSPIWGTNSDNVGSRKVANKLGYEEDFYHPFYCSVLR
jgi:GNAT superfamily N-acetyltransferase